eukprot:scaffold177823_cov38-Prasinocladus_malaysianus.AAC.1
MEALPESDKELLEEMAREAHRLTHGIHGSQEISMSEEEQTLLTMSTLTEEGVMDVKQQGTPGLRDDACHLRLIPSKRVPE